MKIQESAENYLETICILSRKGPVRAVDIAGELAFARPSVSVAMKNLRASGHITVDDSGNIALTDSGRAIAETMYERHILLADWLVSLGVDEATAVRDACRMEHDMSEQSFAAIKHHIAKGGGA